MIHVFKKGDCLDNVFIHENEDLNSEHKNQLQDYEYFECSNEEELFLKLLSLFPKEPYWNISCIMKKFEISATRDFLIKSYCSKCNRLQFYHGEDLFLLLKNANGKQKIEILAICTPYEYRQHDIKEVSSIIKIKKETLPFYLSLFLNRFTARDFYFCFKNITGIRNVPIINYNSSHFYLVKNKSKIISYHVSEDMALRASKLIDDIKVDKPDYFNIKVIKVDDYESLLNAMDNCKIQKSSDFEKYMIDYDWYFDYCISKKHIDIRNFNFDHDVFLIRDKNGETVAKENPREMFNYIKENKLYSEDIFFLKNCDTDYNSTVKFFELFKKELTHDVILSEYLLDINYLEKVTILNSLIEQVNTAKPKQNICYSLTKSNENDFKLAFFNDITYFHKHITSLDYGIENLSHGELELTKLRHILNPILQEKIKANKILSRTDVALNISNLFKTEDLHGEYLKSLKDMDSIIDVDAYLKNDKSACGIVMRNKSNEIIAKISRKLDATTSVEAEIKGAMFALKYITQIEPNLNNICIRYDCFSVADYLVSTPSSEIGSAYQAFVKSIIDMNPNLNIYIKKVRGHSSDLFNDIADSLAGNFFND